MNRLLPLVPVAAVLIGGCGGSPPQTQAHAPAADAAVARAGSAAASEGTLVVGQRGSTAVPAKWFVRVESGTGAKVVERGFAGGAVELTRSLAVGEYRVIAWQRPCEAACPESGEKGLGPLREVCGTPVDIAAGARVPVTVVVGGEGSCSVEAGT